MKHDLQVDGDFFQSLLTMKFFFFNFITVTLSLTFANKHGIVNTLITPPPPPKNENTLLMFLVGILTV